MAHASFHHTSQGVRLASTSSGAAAVFEFSRVPRGGAAAASVVASNSKQIKHDVVHSPSVQIKEATVVERQPIIKEPLRSFPITKSEFPQFAAMSIMMFLFIYVFTTVRDTKDTLVVSNCGAEAIPFLKLYGVM
jgi:hypothetical protein